MSFIACDASSHFPIQNLPYGVFSRRGQSERRICTAIGDYVVDLAVISRAGHFPVPVGRALQQATLNDFMALGRSHWTRTREILTDLLSQETSVIRDDKSLRSKALIRQDEVEMHLAVSIGDYTDFYLSREHATNCGTMLRGAAHALSPNWLSLPVAYHGRSSSIVISDTPVHRPRGQVLEDAESGKRPAVMPCQVLDFELEMGALMGLGNDMGTPVPVEKAEDQIFGMVLLNDWSARDIQKWEMAPLGPFNSKNWASSISPWVVTMDALAPFKCAAPRQAPPPLPYLQEADRHTFNICLEAALLPAGASQALTVTRSNFKHLYWTLPQMVAHHTLGGCNLRPGDLLGTGTISCDSADKQGLACLLEKTWNGTQTLKLEDGTERTYLEDGDTVILRGYCQGDGYRVGFGECKGQVLPCRGG